ncbi:hypothetical protein [Candidatus Formimonas warabiya]|uniref:Uncharacterized protein n=1 Tax=Formimonas warabiya TaxID=1761012 RepID=A0A3G1KNU3_FORW1|nr:hypothetical protein [Candidatus Formimonas warabiya]ATW24151.1 hypothetical protein DCMF_04570 [Candidatus Formimonas warabiya]
MEVIWEILKNTIIPAIFGVMGYVFKQKYDEGSKIKTSARLLIYDINRTTEILRSFLDGDDHSIPLVSLTAINDWKQYFCVVNTKLATETAKSVFEFYSRIENLIYIQKDAIGIMEQINPHYPNDYLRRRIMALTKVFEEYTKVVLETPRLADSLNNLDRLT